MPEKTVPPFDLPAQIRDLILTSPEVVLRDAPVMAALMAHSESGMGGNIIDLRGAALRQLEGRLERLEDSHRSVISAAYDNMAGAHAIQRAIVQLVSAQDFNTFLRVLQQDVTQTLRLRALRLVLESHHAAELDAPIGEGVVVVPAGQTQSWLTAGGTRPLRPVVLHQPRPALARYYGALAEQIGSEAVLLLDIGPRRLPGVLVMGAEDKLRFHPAQGTELLDFFARVFERLMQRWLS